MSQTRPRFSILVAAFNVEATIGRCLQSIVVAKNDHVVELIILDDGSTDLTAEICAHYAHEFPWMRVITQPNAGVSEVRNRALHEAAGEYVAFVDGDDTIEPHYFDFIDGKLRETAADMLVFGHNRLQLDGAVFPRPNAQTDLGREEIARMQLNVADHARIYLLCCARMFRKELASGFIFDQRIKLGEDTAFNIHMINQADSVLVCPDCLYNYFESTGSLSSGTYKEALLESFEAHYEARLRVHSWPDAGTADHAVLKESIALTYVEYVLQYLLNNVRYLPLREQLSELRRIRHSVIYLQCIPNYTVRSPHRGARFLVGSFIRERYWITLFGLRLAGFLAMFRVFIIPSMQWRQSGTQEAHGRPEVRGELPAPDEGAARTQSAGSS